MLVEFVHLSINICVVLAGDGCVQNGGTPESAGRQRPIFGAGKSEQAVQRPHDEIQRSAPERQPPHSENHHSGTFGGFQDVLIILLLFF